MQSQIRKQQEPYINAASTIQGAVQGNKARKTIKQEKLSLEVEKQLNKNKQNKYYHKYNHKAI